MSLKSEELMLSITKKREIKNQLSNINRVETISFQGNERKVDIISLTYQEGNEILDFTRQLLEKKIHEDTNLLKTILT